MSSSTSSNASANTEQLALGFVDLIQTEKGVTRTDLLALSACTNVYTNAPATTTTAADHSRGAIHGGDHRRSFHGGMLRASTGRIAEKTELDPI
jgi:hypothetical protein